MGRRPAAKVRRLAAADAEFQILESLLTNRAKRHRHRRFVVQGVRPVTAAVSRDWPAETVVVASGRRLSQWADGVVEKLAGVDRLEVPEPLFARLAQKDDPGEVLLVCSIPDRSLAGVTLHGSSVVVVLDRPARPGNLGAVVRSSDALGADAVVVTGHAADPYDPAAVRASTGSLFAVPVVAAPGFDDVRTWLAGGDVPVRLVAADEGGDALDGVDLRPPVALVLGSEGRGLTRAAREACDVVAAIPMRGGASSLNLATAATVLLYEVDRRRRLAGSGAPA